MIDLIEVSIEMPDGRVARGRDKTIVEAYDRARDLLERLSGNACDCGVYGHKVKGLHHTTTCAMFKQDA